MAPQASHSQEFFSAGINLGFGLMASLYEQRPEELADHLQVQLKVAAKFIKKATGLPTSEVLEAFARAVKFSNWHHLSHHLSGARTAEGPLPSQWFKSLIPLLPVNAGVPRELPPSAESQALLEQLWKAVAKELNAPPDLILDGVGAQMLGERSWKALLARTPLKATEPLYFFRVDDSGRTGAFEESHACSALVRDLDEQWQGYAEFSGSEQRQARKWVETVLARRPDFLEAGLAMAQMKADAEETDAAAVLDEYLSRAESLIPREFKGNLSWYELGNRFYHRMLYLRMSLYHGNDDMTKAASTARKLLKLNPDDNLGIRNILPLILLSADDYPGASRACKRLSGDGNVDTAAIRAFVHYATDDMPGFRSQLLTSLFTWPIVRAFIENSEANLPEDESGNRGIIPDFESFAEYAWPAYNLVPGLREAAVAFVSDKKVVEAEAHLRNLWNGFWRVPDGQRTSSRDEWVETREKYVAELSN